MPFFLKKYEKTFILTFWALLKCAHRFVDMGCRVWLVGVCEYAVVAKYRWQVGVGAWGLWKNVYLCWLNL